MRATERFSSRADDYARHRPGYPPAAIELLAARWGLTAGAAVADLGSGTGILTRLLIERGARVFAVEPNPPMRAAAEAALGGEPRFVSVAGTAEATTLAAGSVDLVVAGQAFHWFDAPAARREALRILRGAGLAALLWNERPATADGFLSEYEALLRRHAPEYDRITASRADAPSMRAFFGGAPHLETFPNQQLLDLEGLKGRVLSSSYAPERGTPGHEPMMSELDALFSRHERGGQVLLPYVTLVYFGRLTTPAPDPRAPGTASRWA